MAVALVVGTAEISVWSLPINLEGTPLSERLPERLAESGPHANLTGSPQISLMRFNPCPTKYSASMPSWNLEM